MKHSEFSHVVVAILILTIVSGISFVPESQWEKIGLAFLFSTLVISLSILAKKATAHLLDSDVEHEIWQMRNFSLSKVNRSGKSIPAGVIFPLIFTLFSLSAIKFSALLTYESRALKHRAAKRFGFYSFAEMTEWHNALIGASGIIILLFLTLVTYILPYDNLGSLAKISLYYAFWNLLPISKLDGSQIYFGSRILWSILASITGVATPRDYQQAIFETAKKNNTLVVLPTGLGKTLIALLLTIHQQKKHPGSKALIIAPTRPLVEQHFKSFETQLPELFADLQLFTGSIPASKRKKIFNTADIVFSTPQCIANDLNQALYSLENVSLLVIDEEHRCIKNYDYTSVANRYKQQAENPLTLGLTASPGSDASKVKEICKHLDIGEIEIRSRESPDVKDYLQELNFKKVEIPFPKEFIEIRVLLQRIHDKAVAQLKSRRLLFGPSNKISLLQLQKKLAAKISSRDFNAMIGMSLTAQAIKISHAIELLETQTLYGLNEYLQSIKSQAQSKKSKAVQTIVKNPDFHAALVSLQDLLTSKIEHPKIEELATLIESEISKNKKAKAMIFCQFRDTAKTIASRMNKIPKIKAQIFVGQAKKSSSSGAQSGLSQKEQKKVIEKFSSGEINTLVATSIGEEGLDIPEVSTVVFYEPIPSAIRKIQRAGRTARLAPGKLIILVTKDTRDIAFHYASAAKEKKMYSVIETVKKNLKSPPKYPSDYK
jgi:ERCC4-related helicase